MKKISILFVASSLVLSLSACGERKETAATVIGGEGAVAGAANGTDIVIGYDGDGNPLDGSIPEIGAAIGIDYTMRVSTVPASLDTVAFGGTGADDTALVRAVVTDATNSPVSGLEVSFSATGGRLLNADAVTDDNGEATVELSVDSDPTNQDITVTITSGDFSGDARVVVGGTTMDVTGDDNIVQGTEADLIATLTSGTGEPLANQEVTIVSKALNTLSTYADITDPFGQVSVAVDTANGDDTVSFYALPDETGAATVSASYEFTVSDDQLAFALDSPEELSVNDIHPITIVWNFEGEPLAGEDVKFNVTAGNIAGDAIVTTAADGSATVNVASTIAGDASIYAESLDGTVVNKHNFEFVGVTPAVIAVKTTSSRVTTRDRATISVVVEDDNGNPVKDTTVEFSSVNLNGGQISSTSAVTDSDGSASIHFTAGSTATVADGIEIVATVEGTVISNGVSLTVAEPALNVTLGTSNKISEINNNTQYQIPYVVQVADGSGTPLANAEVRLSLTTAAFYKGHLVQINSEGQTVDAIAAGEDFDADQWSLSQGLTVSCANEDANGNRFLDIGEDVNGNGSLDPQDPALFKADDTGLTTIESNGVITTDETGFGYFFLVYPASAAGWAYIEVEARAQALGVESETSYGTNLLTSAPVMDDVDVQPANFASPYGIDSDCRTTR